MNAITENFTLTEGYSLIDLRINPFGETLLVDGKLIALTMPDNAGSIAEYLLRAGATDLEAKLVKLRHVVEGNFLKEVPICSQIYPFLELFASGNYRLFYRENFAVPYAFYEYKSSWDNATSHENFYPYGFDFIATQPANSLSPERIAYFTERMRLQQRPIVLTVTAHEDIHYILDGHHKMSAYQQLGIAPTFISVQRMNPDKMDFDPFDTYFKRHPLKRHYRRYKKENSHEEWVRDDGYYEQN